MKLDAKAARNLFEGLQAGVVLDAQFVELKELLSDTAPLRRLLLGQSASVAQCAQSRSEQERSG